MAVKICYGTFLFPVNIIDSYLAFNAAIMNAIRDRISYSLDINVTSYNLRLQHDFTISSLGDINGSHGDGDWISFVVWTFIRLVTYMNINGTWSTVILRSPDPQLF
ncbi:hypothetical protein CHUAL_001422 [Chamberlinius hualienensis]